MAESLSITGGGGLRAGFKWKRSYYVSLGLRL